jgi:hypothetical protein
VPVPGQRRVPDSLVTGEDVTEVHLLVAAAGDPLRSPAAGVNELGIRLTADGGDLDSRPVLGDSNGS